MWERALLPNARTAVAASEKARPMVRTHPLQGMAPVLLCFEPTNDKWPRKSTGVQTAFINPVIGPIILLSHSFLEVFGYPENLKGLKRKLQALRICVDKRFNHQSASHAHSCRSRLR